MEISSLVEALRAARTDNEAIEAKSAHGGFPSGMAEIVCALANRPGGGTIIFGLAEENNFEAVGVYNALECQRNITNIGRKALSPAITLTSEITELNGKSLVVTTVEEADRALKPITVRSDGKSYLRHYDGTYPLSDFERQMFLASRAQPTYDHEVVAGATIERDLDGELVESYLRELRRNITRLATMDDTAVLANTGIITDDHHVTLTGLLALGVYPQRFFPSYLVQAYIAPDGTDPAGTRVKDLRTFDGPITFQVDAVMNWVSQNTRNRIIIVDGRRHDDPTYPLTVVRELIANALVHRDYSPYSSSIMVTVRLDRDRLVVSNPGGLFGVSLDTLGRSPSRSRNQLLASVMTKVRAKDGNILIERLGTGIPTISTTLEAAGMRQPEFYDTGLQFTATVSAARAQEAEDPAGIQSSAALSQPDAKRVAAALESKPLTVGEIRRAVGLQLHQIRYLLRQLREAGVVVMEGAPGSRNARYRLADR